MPEIIQQAFICVPGARHMQRTAGAILCRARSLWLLGDHRERALWDGMRKDGGPGCWQVLERRV